MSKLKVATVVGTRPEIIRLSQVIKRCDEVFDQVLIHTGQNWDYHLCQIFFENLGLRAPNYTLNTVGENLGDTIGNIIHYTYNLFLQEKPDALLILGDTNSALSAIAAKRLKIPIFHMEAGNRCFDENVPEETNRRLVDHIADINLPYTEHARRNLLAEGLKADHIFVTGSPMPEVFSSFLPAIEASTVLTDLALEPKKYFLVSAHREENIDHKAHFLSLMSALNAVADTYGLPIIFSTHPRTQKMIDQEQFTFNPLIRNLKPLGFMDYNKLQKEAYCVLSDSGTLSEESSLLHFPAVSIRTSTERPESLDKGIMILGGVTSNSIFEAIKLSCQFSTINTFPTPPDYTDTNVSIKVTGLIQSYAPLINQYTFHKS